jgi:hypothetical protein
MYVLTFDYWIDDGKQRTYSIPIYGQTGVASAQTFGTVSTYGNVGTVNATTTYTPTYGVTGSMPVTETEFTRRLTLALFDGNAFREGKTQPVYEGNVVSSGSSGQLGVIVPKMIDSAFQSFPGESGRARAAVIPCPECQ